jgi:hypothetical protein
MSWSGNAQFQGNQGDPCVTPEPPPMPTHTATATGTAKETVAPTNAPEVDPTSMPTSAPVSALPDTGTGTPSSPTFAWWMLIALAVAMAGSGVMIFRRPVMDRSP